LGLNALGALLKKIHAERSAL